MAGNERQQFGKYQLRRRLAVGGMAEIFVGEHHGEAGFVRSVVIKRVLPNLCENPDFVAMFLDEARLLARLSHPNVVQVFDFGRIGDQYFLALEYVRGGNLREVLNRRRPDPLPLGHALFIAGQALAGLDHAHRARDPEGTPLRLVHRDISPTNLLLSIDGAVKLADFGIARSTAQRAHTAAFTIKGKLSYMSPEQVTGQPLDARSDLFSMGSVMWEMLTGRRLFVGDNAARIQHAICVDPIPDARERRPELPQAVVTLLDRALERDRERRFATAADMHLAIDECLASCQISAGPVQLASFVKETFPERTDDAPQVDENAPTVYRAHGSGRAPTEILAESSSARKLAVSDQEPTAQTPRPESRIAAAKASGALPGVPAGAVPAAGSGPFERTRDQAWGGPVPAAGSSPSGARPTVPLGHPPTSRAPSGRISGAGSPSAPTAAVAPPDPAVAGPSVPTAALPPSAVAATVPPSAVPPSHALGSDDSDRPDEALPGGLRLTGAPPETTIPEVSEVATTPHLRRVPKVIELWYRVPLPQAGRIMLAAAVLITITALILQLAGGGDAPTSDGDVRLTVESSAAPLAHPGARDAAPGPTAQVPRQSDAAPRTTARGPRHADAAPRARGTTAPDATPTRNDGGAARDDTVPPRTMHLKGEVIHRTRRPSYGRLSLQARPSAIVILDGRRLGETPIFRRRTKSGWHALELRAPGHQRLRRRIQVPANREVKRTFRLKPRR